MSISSEEERALLTEKEHGLIIKPHPLMEIDVRHMEDVGEIKSAVVFPRQLSTFQYEQRPLSPVKTPLRLQEQHPSPLRRSLLRRRSLLGVLINHRHGQRGQKIDL